MPISEICIFRNVSTMHITEICIFSCISTINMCVCVITSPDDSIYDRGASTPVSGITVLLYHYTLF